MLYGDPKRRETSKKERTSRRSNKTLNAKRLCTWVKLHASITLRPLGLRQTEIACSMKHILWNWFMKRQRWLIKQKVLSTCHHMSLTVTCHLSTVLTNKDATSNVFWLCPICPLVGMKYSCMFSILEFLSLPCPKLS